ncbi:hypothetical protein [Coleofasciculus sp. G2-EDA-02]
MTINPPYEGGQGGMVNAQNTLINHATILFAIALCFLVVRSRKSWQVSP